MANKFIEMLKKQKYKNINEVVTKTEQEEVVYEAPKKKTTAKKKKS